MSVIGRLLAWLQAGRRAGTGEAPAPATVQEGPRPVGRHERARIERLQRELVCWLFSFADEGETVAPAAAEPVPRRRQGVLRELAQRVQTGQLQELPRQPMTLPMLMSALADQSLDRSRLSEIILSDATLTDEMLRVANTSFFRPGERAINSVDQAIFVLGFEGVRKLASAAALRPILAARDSQEILFARRVWRWGLACGQAVERVAQAEGQEPAGYFLLGLVPALATMTLSRELRTLYRRQQWQEPPEAGVIEQALAEHSWSTARLLARRWAIPEEHAAHLRSAEALRGPVHRGVFLASCEVLPRHLVTQSGAEQLRMLLGFSPEEFIRLRQSLADIDAT